MSEICVKPKKLIKLKKYVNFGRKLETLVSNLKVITKMGKIKSEKVIIIFAF